MIGAFLAVALTVQASGIDLGTPEEQRACARDVQRLCASEIDRRDALGVLACIKDNKTKLSPVCRDVLKATRGL